MTDRHDTLTADRTDDRSRPEPAKGPAHDLEVFDKLVSGERTCMFTTVDADGTIYSRPMAIQGREGNVVWFFSYSDAPKLDQLTTHPQVNLIFVDGDDVVSASGTGRVVQDATKTKELWNTFAEAWFQCEPTDPRVALIRVELTGGEYWDSPSKPAQMFGILKTVIGGDRPDDGDNAKLVLA